MGADETGHTLSDMVERVACAMWCNYIRSASPPVEFHKSKEAYHWFNTATEQDREAWRRSARVAIETICEPKETEAMIGPPPPGYIYRMFDKLLNSEND
jgi:hypothetical protein